MPPTSLTPAVMVATHDYRWAGFPRSRCWRVGASSTSACTYLQSARVLLLLLQIPPDTARLRRHREEERGAPFGLPGRFAPRSCGSVAPRQKIPMVYGGFGSTPQLFQPHGRGSKGLLIVILWYASQLHVAPLENFLG
jgi:hypothetical protein